jgi:hypothetical protein
MRVGAIPKKFSRMLSFLGQFNRIPPIPQANDIFGYVIISQLRWWQTIVWRSQASFNID